MASKKIPEVEQKKSDIISQYILGESVIELSKKYGLSRERIYQYLRELDEWEIEKCINVDRKKHQRKIQNEMLKMEVMRDLKTGLSIKDISKRRHISSPRLREMLNDTKYRFGLAIKRRRDRKIGKLYKSGLTQKELSQKYNTTQTNISRILKRLRRDGQF